MKNNKYFICLLLAVILFASCNQRKSILQEIDTSVEIGSVQEIDTSVEIGSVQETDTSVEIGSVQENETTSNIDLSKTYTALEFGVYEFNFSGTKHNQDIKLGETTYFEASSNIPKSINVLGMEYIAKYDESVKGYLYNENIDYYKYTADTYTIEVGLNKNTNIVDYCSFAYKNYGENKKGSSKLTQDECKNIATDILNQYVNSNDYELTNVEKVSLTTYNMYRFWFTRIINGIETKDSAYIAITEYGDLSKYIFTCLGEMENAIVPNADELDAIDASVHEKIRLIYSDIPEEYDMKYETRSREFVKLEDGKYAFEYVMVVNLLPKNSNNSNNSEIIYLEHSEVVNLLVYI